MNKLLISITLITFSSIYCPPNEQHFEQALQRASSNPDFHIKTVADQQIEIDRLANIIAEAEEKKQAEIAHLRQELKQLYQTLQTKIKTLNIATDFGLADTKQFKIATVVCQANQDAIHCAKCNKDLTTSALKQYWKLSTDQWINLEGGPNLYELTVLCEDHKPSFLSRLKTCCLIHNVHNEDNVTAVTGRQIVAVKPKSE